MSPRPEIYLDFDLGASSGGAVLGRLGGGVLRAERIRRFPNAPSPLGSGLYRDFLWLCNNIVESLRLCATRMHGGLAGIGVDTWGVDFGFLGQDGVLIGNSLCKVDTDKAVGELESIAEGTVLKRLAEAGAEIEQ